MISSSSEPIPCGGMLRYREEDTGPASSDVTLLTSHGRPHPLWAVGGRWVREKVRGVGGQDWEGMGIGMQNKMVLKRKESLNVNFQKNINIKIVWQAMVWILQII